jgi:hypothetical protein
MYHPAAALRTPSIERESYEDAALIPRVLTDARERRRQSTIAAAEKTVTVAATIPAVDPDPVADPTDQLTIF